MNFNLLLKLPPCDFNFDQKVVYSVSFILELKMHKIYTCRTVLRLYRAAAGQE